LEESRVRLQPAGLAALLACLVANISAQPDLNYKPRRLNKAIELLEDGQPIYHTNANGGLAKVEGAVRQCSRATAADSEYYSAHESQ
jgi:hypothetical protein